MSGVAVKRGATYQDLRAVPDTRVAELLFGVLSSFPRRAIPHAHLDPLARLLEVFRLENGRCVSLAAWRDDAVVPAEPFDAIELSLDVLWQR